MHQPATCQEPVASAVPAIAPSSLSTPPVIVRLAGLSAQALAPLTSSSCIALLQARVLLEEELEDAKRAMAQAISDTLLGFEPAIRRFLLTIKRGCFNGRDISTYRTKAEWPQLLQISQGLAARIVALEDERRENDRALAACYERELTRERRHILDQIQDPRFLRGVALGRPGLVQQIHAQAPVLVAADFRPSPRKWEQSLLRFLTRAAAKLSANSTLTVYALGSIQSSGASGFRFLDSPRREVSLVRVDRPELEQFQTLLMRHPTVRERSLVAWNDSLEELEPGRYRFLRDGHWQLASQGGFQLVRPARVTARLSGETVAAARNALRQGMLRYDTLVARLTGEDHDSRDQASGPLQQRALDELIDLGVLVLIPPWPIHETHLERAIGTFLQALPDDPMLTATREILDELLTLEQGYAHTLRPEISAANMQDAFSRLLGTVLHLADGPRPLVVRATFFEDVLSDTTFRAGDDQGIFQIASSLVQQILQPASLVSRFAGLFNHRHDLLHTLATWWRDQLPNRREAPFTEIARGFTPLWKQFLYFSKTTSPSVLDTFNPLESTAIEELRARRHSLLSEYRETLRTSPTGAVVSLPELEKLLASLPNRYAPLVGPGVFVQPIDAEGRSWVLNSLFEGTGRYLSRVMPILEGPLQQRLLHHLAMRSVIALEGEEADLLEVRYPWGSLVSAHPHQALKVLDFRGLNFQLPPDRTIGLGDLKIQADLESETFRLIAPSGRRVLPVNLSTLSDTALPNLLRLLLSFGPGETRRVFPFAYSEGDESFRIGHRLTCGNLVLHRRSWTMSIADLRNRLQALNDPQSYAAVHHWRQRLGLPPVGFYYELTYRGTIKPQYIDFTSPSLCRLFVSSLRKMKTAQLTLEEALPSPTDFPFDPTGGRRAFEILIDSLAIGPAGRPFYTKPRSS